MKKSNSILFTVGVHGDEQLPVKVVKSKLKQSEYLICNKKALQNNIRFIKSDLNRSFPGNINGVFEEKLPIKLLPHIKNNFVIDIHTARCKTDPFIILTKVSSKHFYLIKKTGLNKIVIMSQKFGAGKSLIDFAKTGISIESGSEKSRKTIKIISQIIDSIKNKKYYHQKLDIYKVFDILQKSNPKEFLNKNICSFKLVKSNSQVTNLGRKINFDFYPILARSKNYPNFLCLMAKKINYQKLNVKL